MIWSHYLLQVNIYLILFYGFYKLLLDKETYFLYNRIYLVLSGFLSILIPFLRIEWFSKQEISQKIYISVAHINTLFIQSETLNQSETYFNWGKFIVYVYLTGIVFLLIKFLYDLIKLSKIVKIIQKGSAFSFFNIKIIDPKLPNQQTIDLHEDIHIKQFHTLDILFFEVLSILVWFNPIIYLYKKTVKGIHEFLADEQASALQGSKDEYALILLSNAFNIDQHTLTNNFLNKNLLKKRIYMLHKARSKKIAILKYGLFVPLFGVTLLLSSATIRKNDRILEVADNIPLKEIVINTNKLEDKFSKTSEDWQPFYNYLASTVKYPAAAANKNIQINCTLKIVVKNKAITEIIVNPKNENDFDKVIINAVKNYSKELSDGNYAIPFIFRISGVDSAILNEDQGNINGFKMLNNIYIVGSKISTPEPTTPQGAIKIRGLNGEQSVNNEALIVIDSEISENKEVSNIDANKIDEITVLGVANATALYGDKGKNGAVLIKLKEKETERVYDFVSIESLPKYPEGLEAFSEFLSQNVKYPKQAAQKGIQGTVYVLFDVNTDGAIDNVRVDRKIGNGLDEEAIRVIKLSKKWIPAFQNGKAVKTMYTVPVKFSLN